MIVFLLAIALVVLTAVSAMAISPRAITPGMTYKTDVDTYIESATAQYDWSCRTGASLSRATGAMTFEKLMHLSISMDVEVAYGNTYFHKDVDDILSGSSLSVSCNNSVQYYDSSSVLQTSYGSIEVVTCQYNFGGLFAKIHSFS